MRGSSVSTSTPDLMRGDPVSAPSSLAVAAAKQFGQTVVGFLRDDRMNVYAGVERLDLDA